LPTDPTSGGKIIFIEMVFFFLYQQLRPVLVILQVVEKHVEILYEMDEF